MKLCEFTGLINSIESDTQLKGLHIALLAALLLLAVQQGRLKGITVSRSILMRLSHISSLPTYHKYLQELQQRGYIRYRPSYHPVTKSEVDFLEQL